MIKTVINQKDNQVIFDCYFMSQSQFVEIYKELYPCFDDEEFRIFWLDTRNLLQSYIKGLQVTRRPSSLKPYKKTNPKMVERELIRWQEQQDKAYRAMEDHGLLEVEISNIYGNNDKGKRIMEEIANSGVKANFTTVTKIDKDYYKTGTKKIAVKKAKEGGLEVIRYDGKYCVVNTAQKSELIKLGAKEV